MSKIGGVSGSNGWARRRRVEAVRRPNSAGPEAMSVTTCTALTATGRTVEHTSERVRPSRPGHAPSASVAAFHVHGAPRGLKADTLARAEWAGRYAAAAVAAPRPALGARLDKIA